MNRALPVLTACAYIALLAGFKATPRYNSLDLALLPCETGSCTIFFRASEFDADGDRPYEHQTAALKSQFESPPPVINVIVFMHGWNKNPSSAELDYQNFLCRLHARLRDYIGNTKRAGGLLALGVFWPSTITNRDKEPILLKPISYFRIRKRVDHIAETGLANLLTELTPALERSGGGTRVRVHLIGHSFGGRMLVRAFEILQKRGDFVPFLAASESINVVLINPALPAERFDWIAEALRTENERKSSSRFAPDTASYLFNVHSFNDSVNRVLFPIASVFSDDPVGCAAGACGVPGYATVCVDATGALLPERPDATERDAPGQFLNAWIIDATKIDFDHGDIYKGRVATLVADLLYDDKARDRFPRAAAATQGRSRSACAAAFTPPSSP